MDLAFFTPADDGTLIPTDLSRSMWGENHLHGVAVSGALARGAERALAAMRRTDLVPSRYTVDLFSPATTEPCLVSTTVVRESTRICLVDAVLSQGGSPVARASALFLKPTASAPGEVWTLPDAERPVPPPREVAPSTAEPHVPFLRSTRGWSQDFGEHQNAGRKTSWNTSPAVVAGEPGTPFQAVASIADGASLVTNWGTRGVEHINTDLTLAMSRRPVGHSIGLAAVDRVEQDGVAVGTTAVFDRAGPLGTVVVTSLANARRAVDLGSAATDDEGWGGTGV